MISDSEQQKDTYLLTRFIRKNFKSLALFAIIGAAIGLTTALFIPKEYKSTAIVFPPSAPSVESSIDNPNFGYDVEADRLIQILHSNEVRDSVVKLFDLYSYYELDHQKNENKDELIKKYRSDIRFERTPSMSIVLSAQTRSAELSADILNYIIAVTDKVREKIYKQNLITSFQNAQQEYNEQKIKMDSMQFVLTKKLKDNNLNSLIILASNAQISIDMDKLSTSRGDASGLSIGSDIISFKNVTERLKESEGKLLRLKKILNTPVPKLFVIDHAEPRFKKAFPSYLIFTLAGAVFSVAVLLIILTIKRGSATSD
ncbi:MAG: hypothetical protein K0S32_3928 [Bacteroidetes bacterium]|jgi:LPS O-antigen subunit length determinant protein (WzzB/FepE family)|nr:hypothetical protein [Bacteroidota bacterium]